MLTEIRRIIIMFLFLLPLLLSVLPFRSGYGAEGIADLPVTIDLAASAVSSHEVVLTWSDVGATGYTLYEKGSYVDTVFGTAATRRLLNPNSLYCYRVVAFYPVAGSMEQSNQVCVLTPADRTPPTVPANVEASPDALGRMRIAWSGSRDDGIISGYTIFRDGVPIGETAVTYFVDEGVDDGALYCYSVSSYDNSGNESERSDQACTYASTDGSMPPE